MIKKVLCLFRRDVIPMKNYILENKVLMANPNIARNNWVTMLLYSIWHKVKGNYGK